MLSARKELNKQIDLDGGNVPDYPTDPVKALSVLCKYKAFIKKALDFISIFVNAKGKETIRRISLALDALCDE